MKNMKQFWKSLAAMLLTVAMAMFGLVSAGSATVLYATSGAGLSASSLYTIDITTGAGTLVGAIGFNEVVSIDFDPVSGLLYGISNTTGQLITIDTATGAGTAVSTASAIGFQSPDMTFNSSGTLYTWSEPFLNRLNTVDLVTGATTEIGPNSLTTLRTALDVDSTDTIYLKNGSNGKIYTIDPGTGAETFVVSVDPSLKFDNVLAFDPTDTLYTLDRTGGRGTVADLYTIDLLAGTTTFIGSTGVINLAALAFAPESVPEPGTLVLFGAVLAGLGVEVNRRRRHSAA